MKFNPKKYACNKCKYYVPQDMEIKEIKDFFIKIEACCSNPLSDLREKIEFIAYNRVCPHWEAAEGAASAARKADRSGMVGDRLISE